jgi:hypothetical protein
MRTKAVVQAAEPRMSKLRGVGDTGNGDQRSVVGPFDLHQNPGNDAEEHAGDPEDNDQLDVSS